MSMSWGPAVDAEVGYRQQQVRIGFGRATRRAARSTARADRRRITQRDERSAFAFRRPAHAA